MEQSDLKRILYYNPETGEWVWIQSPSKRIKIGTKAGYINSYGYRYIGILKKMYLSSRLAIFYMTGKFPSKEVDHIDGNRSNDRWINLRPATSLQNSYNRKTHNDNKLGIKGVSICKKSGKFVVFIKASKKQMYLGAYDTPEEAEGVYKNASHQFHCEFAKGCTNEEQQQRSFIS